MLNNKWRLRFLQLAKLVSTWSKDGSTKVGAIIANSKKQVVSLGYNGLPRKLKDDSDLLSNTNSRELKLKKIIHAEANAILNAKGSVEGFEIFVYPLLPCPLCASLISQSGIVSVTTVDKPLPTRWKDEMEISKEILNESDIKCFFIPESMILEESQISDELLES